MEPLTPPKPVEPVAVAPPVPTETPSATPAA